MKFGFCLRMVPVLLLSFGLPSVAEPPHDRQGIKTVYVIPSSHWDLGFLAPPEKLLPRLKPHIDEVIANCKADPEFRWTIESSWQLREWLSLTQDPGEIQSFVDLVNSGQIEVSSVWGSMHTEFMGTEQLNHLAYEGKLLQHQLGFKSDFAMMDDVPGFSLMLPQVLARSGVKYFLTGSNLFFGIGGTSLHPSKDPFYWESPDGSKVLMWQTQGKNGGYTEGFADYFLDPVARDPYGSPSSHFYPKEWNGLPPLEIMQRGMNKLLSEYQHAGYPYDAVLVMYLHDFIPATWERDQLLPNIRAWNAAGRQPRIVVATPAEFFHHLESTYGNSFPVYAGEWSGLWSEVKTNSPAMSAKARWAQNHVPVAEFVEMLRFLKEGASHETAEMGTITTDLLKYDEHSGAGQYGWPKILTKEEVQEQNREYAQYTSVAASETEDLIAMDLAVIFAGQHDPTFDEAVVVFNPLGWRRSEAMRIKVPENASIQIRDLATNTIVPYERTSDNEAVFEAESVPAFGYRAYGLERTLSAEPKVTSDLDQVIENSFYRVEVRQSDGAITGVFDKQLNRQLVDPNGQNGLNQILRWRGTRSLAVTNGKLTIKRQRGPLTQTLTITRQESSYPQTRITLLHGQKLVLIDDTIDRSKMPLMKDLNADVYAFSLPLKFTGSSSLWVADGVGFHRFPKDYLPGARTDAVVPRGPIVMESTEDTPPYSVAIAQRESFFDSVSCWPGPKGGCGAFLNEIRTEVMRKADKGDTRDDGVVEFSTPEPGMGPLYHFSFVLSSWRGALDPLLAYRTGADFDLPLIAVTLPPGIRPASTIGDFFLISVPDVVLQAIGRSIDGDPHHLTARLQEIGGSAATFKLLSHWKIAKVDEMSMTEDEVLHSGLDQDRISVGPHQTLTLRLTVLP